MDTGITFSIGERGENGIPVSFQKVLNFNSLSTGNTESAIINNLLPEDKLNITEYAEDTINLYSASHSFTDKENVDPEHPEDNFDTFWNEDKELVDI